jgi:putative Ca2+/H+ antiporter (TMEM165/GDT1 family)
LTVDFAVIGAVFPLVFLAELPDKTMFASLVLASRGRPLAVWTGAAAAFAVHVVLAVSVGELVVHLLSRQATDALASAAFAGGALLALLQHAEEVPGRSMGRRSAAKVATGAAAVIFVAEWGDLTQVLTANLAFAYHSPLSVGVGALAALLVVAGLAVVGGSRLLGGVPVRRLRLLTAGVLAALAGYSLYQALS